jgi:hypothetical protein
VWARLVRDAGWPAPWGAALTYAIVALAVLVPTAFAGVASRAELTRIELVSPG